jgi:hypothetical protein
MTGKRDGLDALRIIREANQQLEHEHELAFWQLVDMQIPKRINVTDGSLTRDSNPEVMRQILQMIIDIPPRMRSVDFLEGEE